MTKIMYNCTIKQFSNYAGKILQTRKLEQINLCNTISKSSKSWEDHSGQCLWRQCPVAKAQK